MKEQQGKKKSQNKTTKPVKKPLQYLLDAGTSESIREIKRITDEQLKYHWDCYAELARQRNIIQDQIKGALLQTCGGYEFSKWQRAVKYKYSLHPLSVVGSRTFIGGRFNTGSNVNTEVPTLSGLYLAQNKDTALQEHLGQETVPRNSKLTPREIALTNPASETIVSVSGKLDRVFDLTVPGNLKPFVDLIKNFTLSNELKATANKLNVPTPGIIKTAHQLRAALLCHDWRAFPSRYDVPSNSQIFGHLVYSSSIEGILYPSKLTKHPCLVLFPQNFVGTDSYVQLDDDLPHAKIPRRIDAFNWRVSELSTKELLDL